MAAQIAMMPIRRCSTPAEANAALAALGAEEALFVFFGSNQPETGASWCPDCVTADPVLRAAISRVRPDLDLFECPVGDRVAWKGVADHPYRTHPLFRVVRIPTLIRVRSGSEIGRLVEADCALPAAVAAFLAP
jgi:hypothetical protein